MGVAASIEAAIDVMLNGYVLSKSAALCAALVPLALTGVTIYIITMGWAIMRGEANDTLTTAFWKFFKIAFISGIALSAGEYATTIVDGIQGIQSALIQAFGGTTTIGGLIDQGAQPFADLGDVLYSDAVTGVFPNFMLLIAAGLVAIAEFFLFIIALGTYLIAKVSLALVLAVGPVFIFCALFPATQRFAESWLGQALSFVFLNVLIAAGITMLTSSARKYAAHILAHYDAAAIMQDTLGLVLMSGALGVVMLNLSTIASALSGGASISGVGRDIGRYAMSKMQKEPPPPDPPKPAKPGGEVAPTGRSNRGGGSGGGGRGAGPQPAYRRRTVAHIQRSSAQ